MARPNPVIKCIRGLGSRIAVVLANLAEDRRVEVTLERFGGVGSDVVISRGCDFPDAERMIVGSRVFFGPGCYMGTPTRITIGDDVLFGPGVLVAGGDHRFDVIGKAIRESGGGKDGDIAIEEDVWVGGNAVILRGVRVGRGAVVGAGAVVTGDVPPYTIVAGVPAREIGRRFESDDIARHERLRAESPAGEAA